MEFLRDILEEHLEEADFLYTQRRNALADDDYDLADLANLEERLLAHVDGLVVAGSEAWELLSGLLTGAEEGEAFTAALVALATGDPERVTDLGTELLAAFGKASGETLIGLREALCLSGLGDLAEPLRDLVAEAGPENTVAVLEVLCFHRRGFSSDEVAGVLANEDPLIRMAGLRVAAAMGWRDFAGRAKDFLSEEDPGLIAEAVRAGFILNDDSGLEKCRSWLAAGDEKGADLQIWLGLGGRAEDAALLAAGLDSPELGRGAVIALGWLGRTDSVDGLMDRLDEGDSSDLNRQIGAAVRRITGVDLVAEGLAWPEVEPVEDSQPETAGDESNADEDDIGDLVEDPDEALPWPDPEGLKAWWGANRSNFKAGKRYRYGRDFGREAVLEVLRMGGLAERHLAACELARLDPEQTLQQTRALAWSQSRRLARIS